MALIDFIESHFGSIEGGFKLEEIEFPNLQVISFRDKPFEGLTTFLTLGVSRNELELSGNRFCKQEFLFTTYSSEGDISNIASVLLTFSEMVLKSKTAILRGEVIGPGERFIKHGTCNSLYASSPVFFGDNLDYEDFGIPVIFVWLMPLLDIEAKEVRKIGWNKFEDILESLGSNYDFWDLNRIIPFTLTPIDPKI